MTGSWSKAMAHVENIENNRSTLLKCINMSVQVVACLRAAGVIDEAKESRLEAEKAPYDKLCLIIDWLKESSLKVYESFLQVMEENDQQHVVNLLKGRKEDKHVPLSPDKYARLVHIRPKLMRMIHNSVDVIAAIRSSSAISETDLDDLSAYKGPNYKKNYRLINAILRRSDYSFECLREALINAHHEDAADYLNEGEVIAVHFNTTLPDLDEKIAESINAALMKKSIDETATKGIQTNESMEETTVKEVQMPHLNGLRVVGATPGHSIIILVYCKTTDNVMTFTRVFNSGELQTKLEDILNRLFARIEPKSTERLKSSMRLDDEDILEIEEITGIEDWLISGEAKSPQSGKQLDSNMPAEVEEKMTDEILSVNRYFPEEDASKKRNASEDEAVYTNYKRKRLLTDDRLNIIKTPSSLLLGLLSPVKDVFSPTKMGAIQYNMGSSEKADKGMKGRFHEIQESLREGAKFVVKCNNRECLDQTQRLELQLKEKDKLLEKQRRLCICSGRANESPWSSLPLFIPAAHKDLMNTTYTSGEIYPLTMSAKKKPFTLNDTKLELPVRTIKTKAAEENKTCICGLTILNKELFVISQLRSEVEVYDSMEFNFRRRWNLSELVDPIDIGSCNRNKCLYIVNSTGFFGELKEILKVDSNTKLIKTWSTGDDIGCLSVTDESTVILTVCNKNKLNEYSPDGELIREINLSSDAGIRHPLHAIKLSNGHFVVSHGSYNDELRRVCLVDADGKLKKSFGGKPGSIMDPMSRPSYMYLSVDGSGCVLVLDERNSRILQLDSDLEFKQNIFSREGQRPLASRKFILDESNGRRLFVAGNDFIEGGQILMFQLK